jgi:hypothetical protein
MLIFIKHVARHIIPENHMPQTSFQKGKIVVLVPQPADRCQTGLLLKQKHKIDPNFGL